LGLVLCHPGRRSNAEAPRWGNNHNLLIGLRGPNRNDGGGPSAVLGVFARRSGFRPWINGYSGLGTHRGFRTKLPRDQHTCALGPPQTAEHSPRRQSDSDAPTRESSQRRSVCWCGRSREHPPPAQLVRGL